MSLTYSLGLKELKPAYNYNRIVGTSSNVGEDNYRYICDLYVDSIKIDTLRVLPDLRGYGIFELNNILNNYIKYKLNYGVNFENITGLDQQHFLDYDITLKEEWTETWVANDFLFSNAIGATAVNKIALTTDSSLFAGGSDITHNYSIDDEIYITSPDEDFVRSGKWRVLEVLSDKTIVTNQNWIQSGTAIDVDTRFWDNRRTENTIALTQSGTLFNGSFDFYTDIIIDDNDIIIGNGSDGILISDLTIIGEKLDVDLTDNFTVNYYGESGYTYSVIWEDGNGVTGSYVIPRAGTLGVGPQNIPFRNVLTSPEYSMYIKNTNNRKSNTLSFKITDNCSKYQKIKLIWLDRLGGWKSFNFDLHSTKETLANKTLFEKENLGYFDPNTGDWTINGNEFGDEYTNIDFEEIYTINSNFMTQEQIRLVQDLFTSRYVFVRIAFGRSTNVFPVILLDNNYTEENLLHRRQKTLSVQFKLSNRNFNN